MSTVSSEPTKPLANSSSTDVSNYAIQLASHIYIFSDFFSFSSSSFSSPFSSFSVSFSAFNIHKLSIRMQTLSNTTSLVWLQVRNHNNTGQPQILYLQHFIFPPQYQSEFHQQMQLQHAQHTEEHGVLDEPTIHAFQSLQHVKIVPHFSKQLFRDGAKLFVQAMRSLLSIGVHAHQIISPSQLSLPH